MIALYSAYACRERFIARGIAPSVSAKGNVYDNAVAEDLIGSLKNELVHH
ncbi:MAG: hypothetical protein HYY78_17065 [Betaproteobacteria bacterium]|nr:hypothetical protein [Betaproteobacteria bacterium]